MMFQRRFYHLQRPDASLSSRFGTLPALMERDPPPYQGQNLHYYHTPFFTPSHPTSSNMHPASPPPLTLPPISYQYPPTYPIPSPSSPPLPHHPHYSILDHLLATLPPSTNENCTPLPPQPIILTEEQQMAMLREINSQLVSNNFDIGILKQVYVALTQIDNDLTGCVSYADLLLTFQRKQISITEQLLRLISAQFVSRKESHTVNYERILSFIGAALKSRSEDDHNFFGYGDNPITPRSQDQRANKTAVYYHDHSCPNHENRTDVLTERDDPVLLRMLESSIKHQFTPIDLEALRISFQRSDRLHRGTLSEQQIKDLCFQHDVRIEDGILERIIHRCKQRGGGQYDWQQFLRYLERVQPVQTSLQMSSSRRPSDFRLHIAHPSSNWPHAESPAAWGTPLHRHISPIIPIYKNYHHYPPKEVLPPPMAPRSSHEVQTLNVNVEDYDYNDSMQHKLAQLEDEVQQLTDRRQSASYQDQSYDTKSPLMDYTKQELIPTSNKEFSDDDSSNKIEKPWFDRFMDAADHFYKINANSSGVMSQNEIIQQIGKVNSQYRLNLKKPDIENALISARRSSGMVDINDFLKYLAKK